ncbi:Ribosomal silencing factor RsfS [Candidatus Fokinia solitaria]|uniref:Ribosomal silencing factor RsfS n=1 Tax=Candidatus Fokinia solitaria TaxID=1802984 RepID=A0A2U8BR72_9RICK|nr:ribosome silencing factor [Candidatus Fokinia solitaria]AWD32837.1 Ribosomal silencing factor RsfS [Candidatus Fokinia solitaria]
MQNMYDVVCKPSIERLRQAKAYDICCYAIKDSIIAEYVIIAECTSTRHAISTANDILEYLKILGISSAMVEGIRSGEWILLDIGTVIMHIFTKESREYYSLEEFMTNSGAIIMQGEV